MGLFTALNISASALSAERERSEVAVSNLANVDTTRTEAGTGPYRRREVVLQSVGTSPFQSVLSSASDLRAGTVPVGGVKLTRVVEDGTDPIRRYDPGHPDADKQGYVAYPAINPAEETWSTLLWGSVRGLSAECVCGVSLKADDSTIH